MRKRSSHNGVDELDFDNLTIVPDQYGEESRESGRAGLMDDWRRYEPEKPKPIRRKRK